MLEEAARALRTPSLPHQESRRGNERLVPAPLVRPFLVIVPQAGGDGPAQRRFAEEHQAVQALGLDRQHEPPPVGVAIRCLLRGPDHLDTSDRQDAPELSRELGVAVADHKSVSAEESVHRIGSCPGDLRLRTDAGAVTGRFTSETQRAIEYPLDNVVYSSSTIHWELGDSAPVVFDGVVSAQGISGTFQDGNELGTFSLQPVELVPPPYRREDITFRNGDVVLAGTLLRPRTPGSHPGIVFLHGSGPESRWGSSFFLADRFARAGVAALVFDKRGVGQSTGDWTTIDYQELAEDYMSAVRFLQQQSGVSPTRVGVYGHSQGGTISPLIASRPGAVAVVIAAAAIGTGPIYEQNFYRTRNDLVDEGLTDPDLSRAMEFYTLWLYALRTGQGVEEYEQASAKASGEKWFSLLNLPTRDHWLWKWFPEPYTI